jgi:hypothetical protein
MTVISPHGAPSLAEAAGQLGVDTNDMDATFGIVPIDPDRGMYAVQVRVDKVSVRPRGRAKNYSGPWSDPRVAPFGPIQGDKLE